MDTSRVFLICVNRLVCEAVEILLRREGITPLGVEMNPQAALARVRSLQPDVVLVEGDAVELGTGLRLSLVQLMYERANLRVIYFSLANSEIDVYSQQQRRLVNSQDLVAAIRASLG